MQYVIKAGILYRHDSQTVLAKIKNERIGSQKKIHRVTDESIYETSIQYLDESKASTSDVRNREYKLIDSEGRLLVSARPGYADGDVPDVVGWPICRMPKVDHANITINGEKYILTRHNSQNYALTAGNNIKVLRIMHKGIVGGWLLEDNCGFAPEILCGIFTFCRYIEQENEFLIV